LILPAATQAPDKVPTTIDPSKAKDRHLPSCENSRTGWTGHWQTVCTEPFKNPVGPKTGNPFESTAALLEHLHKERQLKFDEGGNYIYRTEVEPSMMWIENGINETSVQWCNIPGRLQDDGNACQLCESIHDNYIVPRGYLKKDGTHMCVCKKWGKGSEQFMACNCDLCDALLIHNGLRAQCRRMYKRCFTQGYLGGYETLDNHNAFFRQYNDKYDVGMVRDWLVGEVQWDQSVCKSGIEGKTAENHHGAMYGEAPQPETRCHKKVSWLED
jgi:hypothetical protein